MLSCTEWRLLAVVWAIERPCGLGEPTVEVWAEGDLAAVMGRGWSSEDPIELALRHDEVVGLVQGACSAVVPFRLGTMLRDPRDFRAMIRAQRFGLMQMLERFAGRIEMSLKLHLGGCSGPPRGAQPGLDAIRSLAWRPEDRDERLAMRGGRPVLTGRYLIDRDAVGEFWSAFERIRAAVPEAVVMGSGPWAPYSFCDSGCDSNRDSGRGRAAGVTRRCQNQT
ncbi:MAG: GvpL/GvpF family gas vesicle protein [Myxococcota bacterium]